MDYGAPHSEIRVRIWFGSAQSSLSRLVYRGSVIYTHSYRAVELPHARVASGSGALDRRAGKQHLNLQSPVTKDGEQHGRQLYGKPRGGGVHGSSSDGDVRLPVRWLEDSGDGGMYLLA